MFLKRDASYSGLANYRIIYITKDPVQQKESWTIFKITQNAWFTYATRIQRLMSLAGTGPTDFRARSRHSFAELLSSNYVSIHLFFCNHYLTGIQNLANSILVYGVFKDALHISGLFILHNIYLFLPPQSIQSCVTAFCWALIGTAIFSAKEQSNKLIEQPISGLFTYINRVRHLWSQ